MEEENPHTAPTPRPYNLETGQGDDDDNNGNVEILTHFII